MLEYWIWLTLNKALTRRSMLRLLQQFGSPEAIWQAKPVQLRGLEWLRRQESEALSKHELADAKKLLRKCEDAGIELMTYQDARYPSKLRAIEDAPLLLFYKGRWPDFDARPSVAVVGSRSASAYGLTIARRMGFQLGNGGSIVLSGMARGIDSQAMEGALTANATVVAVLGSGVDIVYPPENKKLYADTLRDGCIISEFAPGERPEAWHFPVRNRILSGLSDAVLVVEAAQKSGALITANLALEQGRDVFAVPGNIGVASCAGSNGLLKQGAQLAESGADILSQYELRYPQTLTVSAQELLVACEAQTPVQEARRVDNSPADSYIDLHEVLPTLPPQEQAIAKALQGAPLLADELVVQCGIPASAVLSSLTMLELKGYIKRLPANRYSLVNK